MLNGLEQNHNTAAENIWTRTVQLELLNMNYLCKRPVHMSVSAITQTTLVEWIKKKREKKKTALDAKSEKVVKNTKYWNLFDKSYQNVHHIISQSIQCDVLNDGNRMQS